VCRPRGVSSWNLFDSSMSLTKTLTMLMFVIMRRAQEPGTGGRFSRIALGALDAALREVLPRHQPVGRL